MASIMFRCGYTWGSIASTHRCVYIDGQHSRSLRRYIWQEHLAFPCFSIELRLAPSVQHLLFSIHCSAFTVQHSLFSIYCSASSRIECTALSSACSMQHPLTYCYVLYFNVQVQPVITKSSCKTVSRVASISRLVHGR